jgi:hypothetical protein
MNWQLARLVPFFTMWRMPGGLRLIGGCALSYRADKIRQMCDARKPRYSEMSTALQNFLRLLSHRRTVSGIAFTRVAMSCTDTPSR